MAKIAKNRKETRLLQWIFIEACSTKSRALEINRQLQKGKPAFLGNNAWFLEYCSVAHKNLRSKCKKSRHEASFYIKEQTQKTNSKFGFKIYYFGPPKKHVFGFWRKNPQICFFVFWLWFSFKNNKCTYVLLFCIFENALKKL